jgi:osmoprotectant transport system ATP-binding protein
MLSLEDVCKSFGDQVVLRHLQLEVPRGTTRVLLGRSGCGKSTVLRLLLGLSDADSGTIRFDGERLSADSVQAVRRRCGYVIQDGGLFPHLTAEGNVTLLAGQLGWDRTRCAARLAELLALTDLDPGLMDHYPVELSGGQRQRVALMRALMLDPDVLLLDEPLAALDPIIRFELQEDLRRIFRSLGKTVVLVTHDLAEAAFFADSIVLMEAGSVAQEGRIDDLLQRPASDFVTRFVGAQRGLAVPLGNDAAQDGGS